MATQGHPRRPKKLHTHIQHAHSMQCRRPAGSAASAAARLTCCCLVDSQLLNRDGPVQIGDRCLHKLAIHWALRHLARTSLP